MINDKSRLSKHRYNSVCDRAKSEPETELTGQDRHLVA